MQKQRHQFFRFKSRQTLNSRSKWLVETLLRNKEVSTLTQKEAIAKQYCCFWPLSHGQWEDLKDRANSR